MLVWGLVVGCAGVQTPTPLPRAMDNPIQVPVPNPQQHLSGYLSLRHRLTGESPWVVVCSGLSKMEVDSIAPIHIRAGTVRSLRAVDPEECVPPREARAEPSVGAILIKSIEFTEISAMLTAQRWRGARSPWEWRERYRFLEGDRQLSMDFFSAID